MSVGTTGGGSPAGVLLEVAAANRAGARTGVYSVCSANRFVLEAALAKAVADDSIVLIESTCNQVNQFGGYMGMTPAGFRDYVLGLADATGCDRRRVILGGDHLGPHVWRAEPAARAMAKARDLVRDCVLAGYAKIHLDASMRLHGDPGAQASPPDPGVAAERAAELAGAAEAAWGELPAGSSPPVYVVGTEVPVPGGELAGPQEVAVTQPRDAERTLLRSEEAFRRRGLSDAWTRVLALVVQPGADFGGEAVTGYDRRRARELVAWLEGLPWPLVFEAHSTDYQTPAALHELVSDHFAVLKVGPALTFAFREAVFALEEVERKELGGRAGAEPSRLRETLERALRADPRYWLPYAEDTADVGRAAYGLSDRARYYWARPEVERALARLLDNLSASPAAEPRAGEPGAREPAPLRAAGATSGADRPADFVRRSIIEVLAPYAAACGTG